MLLHSSSPENLDKLEDFFDGEDADDDAEDPATEILTVVRPTNLQELVNNMQRTAEILQVVRPTNLQELVNSMQRTVDDATKRMEHAKGSEEYVVATQQKLLLQKMKVHQVEGDRLMARFNALLESQTAATEDEVAYLVKEAKTLSEAFKEEDQIH
ncbi:hypothetical protein T484DRAFT_1837293 [Baffinella frigidus]|nr:hypothetical protein T484DRAFT_1837293 [Cryptophyta sp. CCMP2293]